MKTVFVIAGFDLHENATANEYKWLINSLKDKGYNAVPVDISWRHRTPTQYAKEFERFYEQHKTDKNIIVWDSFGAVVAFISATKTRPDKILLCSMSPFFKEDRGKYPDEYAIRIFGKRRMEDLWSYSADKIAADINNTHTEIIVLYGEKEHQTSPNLVARAKDTAKKIKGAKLIEIPNAPHILEDRAYSSAVVEML